VISWSALSSSNESLEADMPFDPKQHDIDTLYRDRLLSEGYPDIEALGVAYYTEHQEARNEAQVRRRIVNHVQRIGRMIDLSGENRKVAVVGCGPTPLSMRVLLEEGYDPVGVEIVKDYVEEAGRYLQAPDRVILGGAESNPLPDASQRIVLMENVLEHVESAERSLDECYRILAPGGVLFVSTTNRSQFSPVGRNGEYRTRFYNWFPRIVKECYIFKHLHYDPRLANFTPRPAVHWFSFSRLCELGRQSGFAQFYSVFDLVDSEAPHVKGSFIRRNFLKAIRRRPWLKAMALTQFGSSIYMLKRDESGGA
jgi:2-polyprenyl-6-hydroxyphenyl methylase/3-demethylubiquinone-9 3-methyltransferase